MTGYSSGEPELRKADIGMAALLFVAAMALRIPFRSQMAYHWDSAELTMAIREYNVILSQPHAPGYFLYVMLGRLVNFFVGDPHASLVWVSLVSGSGQVALLYLLGADMFGRRVGLAAALFALTSPQLWFHSCVALTYVVDSFLVCLTVLCCWRAQRHGCRWADAVIIGWVVVIVGGVRAQTVPGLVPLLAYTFWRASDRRLAKLAVALGNCVLGTLAWMAPMIRLSGGLAMYAEVFRRHQALNAPATFAGGGIDALLWNIFFAGLFCWNGLAVGTILLVCALIARIRMGDDRKRSWDVAHQEPLRVLALWLGPMMLMGTAVAFTKQPGYVLSYLPAWIILIAVIAGQIRKRIVFRVVTSGVCILNALVFLVWPQPWSGVFFGIGRTAHEIREQDRRLAQIVHAVRVELSPAVTAICFAQEYSSLGIRHLQLYLPEFEQYQLILDPTMMSPPDKPMMSIRGGRLDFVSGTDSIVKRELALIVPRGMSLKDYTRYIDVHEAKPLPGAGDAVYTVPIEALRSPR